MPASGGRALLKVEVAGICGTDVKMYAAPNSISPVIMGHETLGSSQAGRKFLERQGLAEGDRVFVEHYVGCFQCEWCHLGEYHTARPPTGGRIRRRRYGYTSSENPFHLWRVPQYMFLPWNRY